jgi:hypothetical protein
MNEEEIVVVVFIVIVFFFDMRTVHTRRDTTIVWKFFVNARALFDF